MSKFEYREEMPEPFGCGLAPCNINCGDPFARLYIMPAPRGGASIHWQLKGSFADEGPYSVQLQTSPGGIPVAHDWIDVGLPVTDACYAVDPERRDFGYAIRGHYRLKLVTGDGTYYSDPTSGLNVLPMREWRVAVEAHRRKRQAMLVKGWDPGWLIKRSNSDARCPDCTDAAGTVLNSQCETCQGTGVQCAYYYPIPCVYANLQLAPYRTDNLGEGHGTTTSRIYKSEMLMVPLLDTKDIWVSSRTHIRYEIRSVAPVVVIHGIVISANVTLAQLPPEDIAYTIDIENPLDPTYDV